MEFHSKSEKLSCFRGNIEHLTVLWVVCLLIELTWRSVFYYRFSCALFASGLQLCTGLLQNFPMLISKSTLPALVF